MRIPRKSGSKAKEELSPEDTQEMFAAGQVDDEVEVDEEELDEEEFADQDWEEEDWDEEPISDEDPDEDLTENPEAKSKEEPEPGTDYLAEAKTRLAAAGNKVKSLWMAGLKKIGDIRLPNHELDGQKVLIVSGVVAIILMVGAAGYLIGKGTGEDIDSARLEGEFAGRKAGAVEGAVKGYAAGFKRGRDIAFEKAYSASYRRNYRRAYEEAGMDPPKAKNIQVPEP